MVDLVQVHVAGTVGEGCCERLFCKLAHQAVGEDARVLRDGCAHLDDEGGLCGLTGYQHKCLFADQDSSDWQVIALSQALAGEGAGIVEMLAPVPMVDGNWLARLGELETAFLGGLITARELAAEREMAMGLVVSAAAAVG